MESDPIETKREIVPLTDHQCNVLSKVLCRLANQAGRVSRPLDELIIWGAQHIIIAAHENYGVTFKGGSAGVTWERAAPKNGVTP
jgi:hypothetical protein